jgi:DNA-binding NarL/FixJ family response regulator
MDALNGKIRYHDAMIKVEPVSVIVVESQPLMLAALSATLSAEGMTVMAEVANSRQAVEIARKKNPRVILFSVGVPSLNDLERISDLRREVPRTLILALTSGEFRAQEQMALEHGAHKVLTRSTPRSELLQTIQAMLQKKVYPANMQVN